MPAFTVVICTHDRSALLERAIRSLYLAEPPAGGFDILVVANACTDDTGDLLRGLAAEQQNLRWQPAPRAGKSYALNRAIPLLKSPVAAFVDDDHRAAPDFLVAIQQALERWPEVGLYCGRIQPDWDGSEPEWVHEKGPYPILPRPIPTFYAGTEPRALTADGVMPGGGNLVVRRHVFERIGSFKVELGPTGHNLGGAEDVDFLHRALAAGEQLRYDPHILQYHAVNKAHLQLGYLMRKSFQRSRASVRIWPAAQSGIPVYLWRKIFTYGLQLLGAIPFADRRRYYLVRLAAALGEIQGLRDGKSAASIR
jgi:glycosyltransferase involved in cell wall biosynthesis